MPLPRFEIPLGAIDGVNKTFVVSTAYQPGSCAVFLNGQLKTRALDDGWVETNALLGIVTLKESPKNYPGSPDVVQIFYLDTSPALPEEVIEHISGVVLDDVDVLTGTLLFNTGLYGVLDDLDALDGTVASTILTGVLEETETLQGYMEVCQ